MIILSENLLFCVNLTNNWTKIQTLKPIRLIHGSSIFGQKIGIKTSLRLIRGSTYTRVYTVGISMPLTLTVKMKKKTFHEWFALLS